jgi:TonB-linked SusC/RagA family outer membrane protein
MLMLCNALAFAQTRVVAGKVTDKEGNPVSFASIKIKGTRIGTQADSYGAFSIKAKDADVLEITAVNFKTIEANVGTLSFIGATLEKTGALTEVVVTSAFGLKRTSRSVSYNAQVIGSEQLNTIRQTNVNNALAGKVSGIQVRSQSAAALGRQTQIRLRGESDAGGGAANPIFVVDGTIVPNNTDINPDDIDDMTVLQGPAAGAQFGPDGANGAIVITTKRAKKTNKGIGIDFNTGVQFDKVYVLPNYQNSYAGGSSNDLKRYTWVPGQPEEWKQLDGKFYPDYTDDASWGPRMAGQEYIPWYSWYPGHERSFKTANLTPQPNNAADFYNTGVTNLTNVSLTKAGDAYSFRASYTNQDVKGLIPTTSLKKHTLNINASFELSPNLTLSTNITALSQLTTGDVGDDGYSNQSSGSFNQWFHRDLDMGIIKELKGLRSPDGTMFASWNHQNPESYNPASPNTFYQGNYWTNHFSYFDNQSQIQRRDRLFGDIGLTYKFSNSFKVRATYRRQQLTTNSENTTFSDVQPSVAQSQSNISFSGNSKNNGKAYYGSSQTYFGRNIIEVVASYTKKIKDFAINLNGGAEIVSDKNREITAGTLEGLSIPNLYTLSNSLSPIEYTNQRTNLKRNGVFIRGDVGYKNFLFVDFSLRNDYVSSLPVNDNRLFSKSVGGSFVFSDLIKNDLPFLSFGKIRASYGEVPRYLGAYQLAVAYTLAPQNFGTNPVTTTPGTFPDPGLKGAVANTTEFGLELRFLKNRIGLTGTYYIAKDIKSPILAQVNGTSGITALRGNFGSTQRKGIELTLNVKPIVTKNMQWDITAAYANQVENKVTALAPGVPTLIVSSGLDFGSFQTPSVINIVGERWGQMFGNGILRKDGVPVIDANGLYIKDPEQVKFGSVLPDFTGGVQNSFTVFKNFVINVNIDYQSGGKFFSLSNFFGTGSGLLARTAELNDKGVPVRDPVADGGGVAVTGVDQATQKVVTRYVEAFTYFRLPQARNYMDEFIYDLTFVKMRELSVAYKIPVSKLRISKYLTSATFSIVSRNPWLIYAKTKDFDPSEISGIGGEQAQFPGTRSIGFNLRLGF